MAENALNGGQISRIVGLEQFFKAMEPYTAENAKAYDIEELLFLNDLPSHGPAYHRFSRILNDFGCQMDSTVDMIGKVDETGFKSAKSNVEVWKNLIGLYSQQFSKGIEPWREAVYSENMLTPALSHAFNIALKGCDQSVSLSDLRASALLCRSVITSLRESIYPLSSGYPGYDNLARDMVSLSSSLTDLLPVKKNGRRARIRFSQAPMRFYIA